MFLDENVNGFQAYQKPLDFEECKVVIDRIAKFHACSYFMNENVSFPLADNGHLLSNLGLIIKYECLLGI